MITAVLIPKMTIAMEEGNLVRWLKREGDSVKKDEILFELETDKVVVEVPSPATGILRKILVGEGTVAVGATVGFVGEPSDAIPEMVVLSPSEPGISVATPAAVETTVAEAGIVRATPAARRRARELGVNIARIRGTGPEGRITQEDIEQAAAQTAGIAPAPTQDFRRVIAERMTHAWRTVPHIHIGGELRATGLRVALEKARRTTGTDVSITDLLLFAVASLLPKFPALNSVWHEGRPEVQRQVHLAFAVQTERGVVAPVIRDAARRTLEEISAERRRLTEAALARRLKLSEVEGGTFTLTNLGMYPVDFFVPIINYPQSAILATGRLREEVEIREGTALPTVRLWANLAVDHRVADGAGAAEFLEALEREFASLENRV